ncbi:MAG: hypothetical protein ACK4ON_02245, partial [Bacteroidia bacterium]
MPDNFILNYDYQPSSLTHLLAPQQSYFTPRKGAKIYYMQNSILILSQDNFKNIGIEILNSDNLTIQQTSFTPFPYSFPILGKSELSIQNYTAFVASSFFAVWLEFENNEQLAVFPKKSDGTWESEPIIFNNLLKGQVKQGNDYIVHVAKQPGLITLFLKGIKTQSWTSQVIDKPQNCVNSDYVGYIPYGVNQDQVAIYDNSNLWIFTINADQTITTFNIENAPKNNLTSINTLVEQFAKDNMMKTLLDSYCNFQDDMLMLAIFEQTKELNIQFKTGGILFKRNQDGTYRQQTIPVSPQKSLFDLSKIFFPEDVKQNDAVFHIDFILKENCIQKRFRNVTLLPVNELYENIDWTKGRVIKNNKEMNVGNIEIKNKSAYNETTTTFILENNHYKIKTLNAKLKQDLEQGNFEFIITNGSGDEYQKISCKPNITTKKITYQILAGKDTDHTETDDLKQEELEQYTSYAEQETIYKEADFHKLFEEFFTPTTDETDIFISYLTNFIPFMTSQKEIHYGNWKVESANNYSTPLPLNTESIPLNSGYCLEREPGGNYQLYQITDTEKIKLFNFNTEKICHFPAG